MLVFYTKQRHIFPSPSASNFNLSLSAGFHQILSSRRPIYHAQSEFSLIKCRPLRSRTHVGRCAVKKHYFSISIINDGVESASSFKACNYTFPSPQRACEERQAESARNGQSQSWLVNVSYALKVLQAMIGIERLRRKIMDFTCER